MVKYSLLGITRLLYSMNQQSLRINQWIHGTNRDDHLKFDHNEWQKKLKNETISERNTNQPYSHIWFRKNGERNNKYMRRGYKDTCTAQKRCERWTEFRIHGYWTLDTGMGRRRRISCQKKEEMCANGQTTNVHKDKEDKWSVQHTCAEHNVKIFEPTASQRSAQSIRCSQFFVVHNTVDSDHQTADGKCSHLCRATRLFCFFNLK